MNKLSCSPSWDIVVYTGENSVTYVPSSWAINSSKTKYLWPKIKSMSRIKKMQDECIAPCASLVYDECEAVCKATVFSLERAQSIAEALIYTSNLSSDENVVVNSTGKESLDNIDVSDDLTRELSNCRNAGELYFKLVNFD